MQGALQPIIENLILLDRLEFLLESGKVEVAVVKRVIPKSVSPRNMVLFAVKNVGIVKCVLFIAQFCIQTQTTANLLNFRSSFLGLF